MKIERVAELEAWDIVGIRQGRSNIAQRLASGSEKDLVLGSIFETVETCSDDDILVDDDWACRTSFSSVGLPNFDPAARLHSTPYVRRTITFIWGVVRHTQQRPGREAESKGA